MKKANWKKEMKRAEKLLEAVLQREDETLVFPPEQEIYYFNLGGLVMPLSCAG